MESQYAMETIPETVETTPTPMKTLEEHVADILHGAPKPLAFAALKSALKNAGVPTSGKDKVTDAAIQSALDAAIEGVKGHLHPHKKPEGKPAYWHKPPVTQADIDAEKARRREAKADEKAKGKVAKAQEKAGEKAAKADEKARDKVAKATEKAGAKAAEADRIAKEKAAEVSTRLRAKVSELGAKPVGEKQLGKPKASASAAEHGAFEATLEALIGAGELHPHAGKYGKHAPLVTRWYESKSLKKPFAEAVKAARKIVDSGKVDFEELAKCLKEKLDEKLPEPEAVAAPELAPE